MHRYIDLQINVCVCICIYIYVYVSKDKRQMHSQYINVNYKCMLRSMNPFAEKPYENLHLDSKSMSQTSKQARKADDYIPQSVHLTC